MARNSIGIILVAGMIVGTVFTLFVVPVFYSLLAADHHRTADVLSSRGHTSRKARNADARLSWLGS